MAEAIITNVGALVLSMSICVFLNYLERRQLDRTYAASEESGSRDT
jgi:hypothetical protein